VPFSYSRASSDVGFARHSSRSIFLSKNMDLALAIIVGLTMLRALLPHHAEASSAGRCRQKEVTR
jgi:hypothetical protein